MLEIFDNNEYDLNKDQPVGSIASHLLEEEQRLMLGKVSGEHVVINSNVDFSDIDFSIRNDVEKLIEEYQSYRDNCMPSYARNEEEITEGIIKREVYDGVIFDLKELLKKL